MKIPQKLTTLLAILIAMSVFVLDSYTPKGYGDWVLYIIPILLFSGIGRERLMILATILIFGFLISGIFLSPAGFPLHVAVINRFSVYIVFWLVTLIITSRNRALQNEMKAKSERDRLEATVIEQARFPLENPNPVLRITHEGIVIFGNDSGKTIKSLWNGDAGSSILEPWRSIILDAFSKSKQMIIELQSDGQTFSLLIVPVTDKQYVNLYGRDITDQIKAEAALKSSEEKYRFLFTNTLNGMVFYEIITDTKNRAVDYRFLEVNPAFEQIIGLKSEEVIGKTARELFPGIENDPADWIGKFGRVAIEGERMLVEQKFALMNRWFRVAAFKTREKQFCVVFEDITQQRVSIQTIKDSENRLKILNENLENIVVQRTQQVQDLSKALTLAEQRERKRFSYILHEKLQQLLLGANLLLNQHLAEHKTAAAVEEFDDVADGLELLNKAIQTTKTLSIELNPPILSTEGLDLALEWLVRHMQASYGLEVDLFMEGEIGQIRDETQLMLTQMVRELLNNVVHHSGVHNAGLEAVCKNKQMKITVSDNGKGFIPDEVLSEESDKTRLGLISIKERLRMFGGNLYIKSGVNKGTIVVISLSVDVCE